MTEPEKKKKRTHPWRAFIPIPKKDYRDYPDQIPFPLRHTKKNRAK